MVEPVCVLDGNDGADEQQDTTAAVATAKDDGPTAAAATAKKKRRDKHTVPRGVQMWFLDYKDRLEEKHNISGSKAWELAVKQVPELFAELDVNTWKRWKRDKLPEKRAGKKNFPQQKWNIAKSRLGCNVSTGWAWSFLRSTGLSHRSTAATRDKLKFTDEQHFRL
eukprot:5278650-Amphidinium_carterae.1